jgi:hypothetical protein
MYGVCSLTVLRLLCASYVVRQTSALSPRGTLYVRPRARLSCSTAGITSAGLRPRRELLAERSRFPPRRHYDLIAAGDAPVG